MGTIAKCAYCGKTMIQGAAYKEFSEDGKITYFCRKSEVELFIEREEHKQSIYFQCYCLMGRTFKDIVDLELNVWLRIPNVDYRKIDLYIAENIGWITERIDEKHLVQPRTRLKYLSTCIKNHISTFNPPKEEPNKQITEFYEVKSVYRKRRKSLSDYEGVLDNDD